MVRNNLVGIGGFHLRTEHIRNLINTRFFDDDTLLSNRFVKGLKVF